MVSGIMTTKFGHYMPFILLSVLLTSVGSGLLTTLQPNTPVARWVGYQIIAGYGVGCAFQLPQIAVQTVLGMNDVPVGVAITLFATIFGGSLFVSAGNNVLDDRLVTNISKLNIPNLDPHALATSGATALRSIIPPQYAMSAILAYNGALTKVFQVAVITSCLSALGAAGMQWRSVKDESAGKGETVEKAQYA